ncbi:alcohol dehydrogenase catalytic domain-containing protein [Frankia sp. CNm7]|uniref:Alcohol dehydrogenase catalytic domain-containing protein n=1 Tax=Frankia nepalensis TaxID=1836974 RepID=A0A937RQZ6_9ACTN|nr:alcohol dehydrogenase catalytic domain-containing protein [Frankia nepalensis]MBL7502151.1 alcohol dehydrogenase catalytic domain-containing protein [Frankia nepalensis]MBL7510583.1 alcohol dehydrogenase catalytic domain-containing protein [Frankia nepalensis]MBL7523916.1 alcohol dehydrogenase catalytic domain-containing protein [Frankia nepalensis]MBL7633370.1 alcohol dehydrogenase catalytic domain-containing protein [Frankia nepalensis]
MRAVLQRGFGGVEVLAVESVPDPTPGPGEVVVQVAACGVNHLDIMQRRGPAKIPGFALPHIAGMDVAGTVAAVGPEVTTLASGDRVVVNPGVPCFSCPTCLAGDDGFCHQTRVIGATTAGGYAEYVLVPARNAHLVPDHVPLAEAALVPTIWSTAWHAVSATGGLTAGETVLVHAAASGVSLAAIQLAKQLGATVVATASSADKLAFAGSIGADHLVLAGADTPTEDVVGAVKAATGGRGVDMVLDHVGPATWPASVFSLAPRGRLVFVGDTTGPEVTIPLEYAFHFGLKFLGSDPYPAREFAQVLERYWRGGLVTPVDAEFALADAAAAQTRLEERRAIGKVLLRP